ncbi:hypothetical protein TPHA_0P00810 [Tetrapisispora phaffii CBS 4417]|uniref:Cyclin N-terminal domain-containing protein n=1 Tax=Tetrapisispora phaffii (strain ATCC 24235 / CBS 4417 / NBRC 1672 / NRRL Y-8282 / UCD 70-5) TaxID=1071381 RepID=G8C261_TETPH|nr:hypothetical protein TPHA_0P00810 [Tetrapisispora phaffii CBS 4417]CCE66239.1 hypothetical protein TPHA_0P00810 [Tetrapisispora phaffii CBS 4417]
MSGYSALLYLSKQPVSRDMVKFLVSSTEAIIPNIQQSGSLAIPSLTSFICDVVKYSKVKTPTLMASTVFLNRLRCIIPGYVEGIATATHRLFLGCLILASKTLNDSSPFNKHWEKYCRGLLSLMEINTIERELLEYMSWNVRISTEDLIDSLSPLLQPIQEMLTLHDQHPDSQIKKSKLLSNVTISQQKLQKVKPSSTYLSSNYSIPSLSSSVTFSSAGSSEAAVAEVKKLQTETSNSKVTNKQKQK